MIPFFIAQCFKIYTAVFKMTKNFTFAVRFNKSDF